MTDLTIIHYTANKLPETTAGKIRAHLLEVTRGEMPIISVSQKPIDFGVNICVGDIGQSKYNVYKQIYIGLQQVKTEYIATSEDDTLYNYEHFTYRPTPGKFAYDANMWFADPQEYWRRNLANDQAPLAFRGGMFGNISRTEDLLANLKNRYENVNHTNEGKHKMCCGEPGIVDLDKENPEARREYFEGRKPLIVFRYKQSLGGLWGKHWRDATPANHIKILDGFGDIETFWKTYWDN